MKSICIMILAAALCGSAGQLRAQRCLPGQKALQLTAGMVDGFSVRHRGEAYSFFGGVAYSRYNRNHARWVLGAEYLQKDYTYRTALVPLLQITGEAGYYVPLLSDRGKNVVLSLGCSAVGGYEATG